MTVPSPCLPRYGRHLSMVLIVCLLAGCQGARLMPTPNMYVQSPSDPFAEVPAPLRTNTVDVLYATDRQPLPQAEDALAYGHDRSPSLAFGSCVVGIGQDVSWDTLVAESRQRERSQKLPLHIRAITEQARFPATPLPLVASNGRLIIDPTVQAAHEQAAEQLRQAIRQRLAVTSRKAIYVYIHGFNNTFEDGAYVIAQLWHFLGRQGVPMLYTWPAGAGGSLRGYTHDRESGEFTIYHLKQFLRVLASAVEVEQVHLIAHSRGTDVLTSALRELIIETRAAGQDPRTVFRIRNVVLAAADLDMEIFAQRLASEQVGLAVDWTTLYVSETDRAIGFSGCLFISTRRIGQVQPDDLTDEQRLRLERVARVSLIDARVSAGFLGHSYFYAHPAVSADLIRLLRDGFVPGSPGRPLRKRDEGFWQITNDYLKAPEVPRQ
jgi:esterase/lipase superfamily enzyme